MITGNKGEWSEIYTLLKLLGEKNLHLGTKEIEKLKDVFYPIIKILRSENNGNFEYAIEDQFVFISGNEEVLKVPIEEFREKARFLLSEIKKNKNRTFSVPEIEMFMNSINCFSLKANSSVKTDIRIVIHDQKTNQTPTLGFSIKSQLGSPSTLLNAGKTTNFIFDVKGLNKAFNIDEVNSIATKSKIKDRIKTIEDKSGVFVFDKTEKNVFSNNLILIDSLLPEILSKILYIFNTSKQSKLTDLVDIVSEENPLKFDLSNEHQFYEYKIKRFLTDIALGMMPSLVWNGKYDATGGYLVVKDNGDILCYHIYNKNEFEEYLLNNTKLETASSSRHDFGTLYKVEGKFYFKLNLQIRFIK